MAQTASDRLTPFFNRVIFRTVFGRWPTQAEMQLLREDAGHARTIHMPTLFRRILNRFDLATHPTAFSVRMGASDVRVVEYAGVKVAIDRTEPAIGRIIERGDYEPHMLAFFQRVLRPAMTVIDVGANIGLFSLLAAKLVGEKGRVYSIEPRGENARLLLYSASINNFTNIHLLPTAVGEENGYSLYRTHVGSNGSLLTKPDAGFNVPSILHPTCQVVPLARLDDLVRAPVDLLKLDIEGAEAMALRGASELIRSHRPLITSEASAEMLGRVSGITLQEYLAMTRNQGYRQFVIDRQGGPLQEVSDLDQFISAWSDFYRIEDFAFVPAEKMEMLGPGITGQSERQFAPSGAELPTPPASV
jgi:FkbM family methyltransferase